MRRGSARAPTLPITLSLTLTALVSAPALADAPAETTEAAETTETTETLVAPYAAQWALATDLAFSPYSEGGDDAPGVMRGLALGAHATHRWGRWGLGLALEGTLWRLTDVVGEDDWFAALHIGPEGEVLSAGGRIRTRLGGGLAVLLEGSPLDDAGEIGFYLDIRPAGFRWALGETVIGLDPLTLFTTVPDAGGIPLVDVQYRFCVYAEFGR